MTIAWVVGSGGVLGSALCRALRCGGTELFLPAERLSWSTEVELVPQIEMAVRTFAARASAAGRWEIYWAAGVGTMGSSQSALEPETRMLSALLRSLESDAQLMATPGGLAFSSSAGAIYTGSPDYIVTENTSPAPTTAYARAKLRQEEMVRSFVQAEGHLSAVLARLSTLYGPGQSYGRQQGLLTHIARCILNNVPVQIYVPFDTIRDYIAADDAAASIVATLHAAAERPGLLTKIIASEQPATIAEIIATFRRVVRRAPRVIASVNSMSSIYPHCIRFQSLAVPRTASLPRRSLLVGIAQLMAAERAAFMRGRRTGLN